MHAIQHGTLDKETYLQKAVVIMHFSPFLQDMTCYTVLAYVNILIHPQPKLNNLLNPVQKLLNYCLFQLLYYIL
jgi:hypothetical protein